MVEAIHIFIVLGLYLNKNKWNILKKINCLGFILLLKLRRLDIEF